MTNFAPVLASRLGIVAMMLALQCSPALAVEVDDAAKSNVASSPQGEISWISGGVGDEAMAEMHKLSAAYNVRLLLTGPRGNYLAAVPFRVSRGHGNIVASGVTEGPLLYLKLATGSYQIAVELDGAWQTRHIQASVPGRAISVRFVAKSE